mgnify:CR=1 FL=1
MTIELIKRMIDACFLAKRARDLLPALPKGVTPAFIQYMDAIQNLESRGVRVKVSDISDELKLPRPGVTRTVKEMELAGYLRKESSTEDGRVTYLSLTEAGKTLSQKYNQDTFLALLPAMEKQISDEDAACMIRTMETLFRIMNEQ